MLCPTCETAYGDRVEGPWVTCEHGSQTSLQRPFAGIIQMLWQPIRTLDYIRIKPSLVLALFVSVPSLFVQMTYLAAQPPHMQSASTATVMHWIVRITHTTQPIVLGLFGVLERLSISILIAGSLHIVASLMEGRGRFSSMWSATLFIESMVGWSVFISARTAWCFVGFEAVENFYLMLAVARIYAVRPGAVIRSRIISLFLYPGFFVGCFVIVTMGKTIWKDGARSSGRLEHVDIAADLNWTVQGLNGQSFSMQQLRGHVTVLNVWATWCGPCRQELPSLVKLAMTVKGSSIQVIEVSNEPPENVIRFLKRFPYNLNFYVREAELPPEFRSEAIPMTYIINSDGHIVARKLGGTRWNDRRVVAYLQGLERRPAP